MNDLQVFKLLDNGRLREWNVIERDEKEAFLINKSTDNKDAEPLKTLTKMLSAAAPDHSQKVCR